MIAKYKIKSWLRKHKIEHYTIRKNLANVWVVDVAGDVVLRGRKLKSLPVQFSRVTGSFNVHNNLLISLKGCPEYVGNTFTCSSNKLVCLEYCPLVVKHFVCSQNLLTNLIGCPVYVESFAASNNQLTSLEGAPIRVEGDFVCDNNRLTTLYGAPKIIAGNFICHHNQLANLVHAPVVGKSFDCRYNVLTSVEGSVICLGNPLLGNRQYLQ